MADPADFLDYGDDICPRCGENKNLSLGGKSIFCPMIPICRLCCKAEVLVNRIWSTFSDREKLRCEVEQQLQWSLCHIRHEMVLAEAEKDGKRIQEIRQAKQMVLRVPAIIANSTQLEQTFAEFTYSHGQSV